MWTVHRWVEAKLADVISKRTFVIVFDQQGSPHLRIFLVKHSQRPYIERLDDHFSAKSFLIDHFHQHVYELYRLRMKDLISGGARFLFKNKKKNSPLYFFRICV